MSSGLAQKSPFVVQVLADVLGREIAVPEIDNATAVGAAIQGAVASSVVVDFADRASRFGAQRATSYCPDPAATRIHDRLFATYRMLSHDAALRHALRRLGGG